MALYNFFHEGFDPTSIGTTPSNSQLLQMIHEARPASGAGMFVWSATAPDVVVYPDLALSIWGKTLTGVPTGAFYFFDGATWQPWEIELGTLSGSSFAVGSIPVDRLVPGSNNTVLTTNGSGTIAWQSVSAILGVGTIAYNNLVNATGAGYILLSGVGGVWAEANWASTFQSQLNLSSVAIAQIYDADNQFAANQVLYVATAGGAVLPGWADNLLRENSVATSKLSLGLANAGKVPVVNALGTDFEYIAPATTAVAVLYYGGAAATAPQAITSGGERTVQLNGEQDPSSIVTLAANQFTFAATGNYLIEVDIAVYPTSGGNSRGHIIIKNATDVITLATNSFFCVNGNGYSNNSRLSYILTVSDIAKVYDIRVYADANTTLHTMTTAASVGGYDERYQQVTITKLT
jgi:hypothetical protein